MFTRTQLLYDEATRVIVYLIFDGPRAQLPEVSEDLAYYIYAGEAPDSFGPDNVLDHMLTPDYRIVKRDAEYAGEMPRLRLLSAKCSAMWKVFDGVSFRRRPYTKNLPFQGEIYGLKEREARKFKREHAEAQGNGGAIPEAGAYPFLKSYAALYHMEPIDVAELVLLKARERTKALQVTEHMRLYWTQKVAEAKSLEEVDRVSKQMVEERFRLN